MTDYLYQVITGQDTAWHANLVRSALRPLSVLYRCGLWLGSQRHTRRSPDALPCAVVSVGNIVAGGTGKTVIVSAIARYYKGRGLRTAIVTRGYGGRHCEPFHVVTDGKVLMSSVERAGDEAIMLANQARGIPIVVGRDRVAAAKEAVRRWEVEVVVLDDAFQYRRLARNLDVVAVPATQPWGTGHLLPAGTLREPPSNLRRADLIVLTHTDQSDISASSSQEVQRMAPQTPMVRSIHRPHALFALGSGCKLPLEQVRGRRVVAVSGIGTPAAFHRTLHALGAVEIRPVVFRDHYRYAETDCAAVRGVVAEGHYDMVVTTEKDAVKLPKRAGWYCLRVQLCIPTDEELWKETLERVLG